MILIVQEGLELSLSLFVIEASSQSDLIFALQFWRI